jgi:hypoxanthine phosphoribosyltransferase
MVAITHLARKADQLAGLIGVVAGLITIVIALGSVYAWVRTHALILPIHDPAKPVRGDNLSVVDVSKAMQRMVEDARQYRPDLVVGINRGGAIVGGWLAKQLELDPPALLIVNSDQPPNCRVTPCLSDAGKLTGRIYLVDDAQRKGEHMREAAAYLTGTQTVSEIRRAVLLQMKVLHMGPEAKAFRYTAADFAGFSTSDANVVLPWDK